jgi:hypothetical protein
MMSSFAGGVASVPPAAQSRGQNPLVLRLCHELVHVLLDAETDQVWVGEHRYLLGFPPALYRRDSILGNSRFRSIGSDHLTSHHHLYLWVGRVT